MKLGNQRREGKVRLVGAYWYTDIWQEPTSRTDQISQHGDLFFLNIRTLLNVIQLDLSGFLQTTVWLFPICICLWLLKRMHLSSAESSFLSRPLVEFLPVPLPACSHLQVQSQYSQGHHSGHWWRALMKNISEPKTLAAKYFSILNHYNLLLLFSVC